MIDWLTFEFPCRASVVFNAVIERKHSKDAAWDFDRQVVEIQVCIVALNGYTVLGVSVTEAVR